MDYKKEELLSWRKRYDEQEDFYNKGDEEILRKRFQTNNFMTKEDLTKIHKWKFQGNLVGRQKRMLNLLKDFSDEDIKEFSKKAFKSKSDEERIIFLSNIPSVKNSLSSVILTFYDSKNYGILDIHSWRELFGKEPKDIFSNRKKLLEFLNKLRDISVKTGLTCRDIEKALFKKNLDESK